MDYSVTLTINAGQKEENTKQSPKLIIEMYSRLTHVFVVGHHLSSAIV